MGSGNFLIVGLYTVIVIESMTAGFVLHYAIWTIVHYGRISPEKRQTKNVLFFTFMIITLIGHLLMIPCICFAVHNHSAKWLIPYMIWRMLLTVITLGITVWQALVWSNTHLNSSEMFHRRILPLSIGAIAVGSLFFAITMKAHREFTVDNINRSFQSQTDLDQ